MHTLAVLFLTEKPFKDTPERDERTSALSRMGLKLVRFVTSAEVYLVVFPETVQKVNIKRVWLDINKLSSLILN